LLSLLLFSTYLTTGSQKYEAGSRKGNSNALTLRSDLRPHTSDFLSVTAN